MSTPVRVLRAPHVKLFLLLRALRRAAHRMSSVATMLSLGAAKYLSKWVLVVATMEHAVFDCGDTWKAQGSINRIWARTRVLKDRIWEIMCVASTRERGRTTKIPRIVVTLQPGARARATQTVADLRALGSRAGVRTHCCRGSDEDEVSSSGGDLPPRGDDNANEIHDGRPNAGGPRGVMLQSLPDRSRCGPPERSAERCEGQRA